MGTTGCIGGAPCSPIIGGAGDPGCICSCGGGAGISIGGMAGKASGNPVICPSVSIEKCRAITNPRSRISAWRTETESRPP